MVLGDPIHVPNVMKEVKKGKLLMRLGNPSTVFQHCYVENTSWAHLCAVNTLLANPSAVGGKTFIITDQPAMNFWDFFEPIAAAEGLWYPPRWLALPGWLAMLLAYIVEFICWMLSPLVHITSSFVPGAVIGVVTSQGYTGNRAMELLGYQPIVTPTEAMNRTIIAYQLESNKKKVH